MALARWRARRGATRPHRRVGVDSCRAWGWLTSANTPEILDDHDIELAAFNQLFKLKQFASIQMLAAPLALDDVDLNPAIEMLLQVFATGILLVCQTSWILVIRADSRDNHGLQHSAIFGAKWVLTKTFS